MKPHFLLWSLMIVLLCSCNSFQEKVSLGEVTWIYHSDERNDLLIDGETVISLTSVTLWGEYPYIAGDCVMNGLAPIYFIIDMRTKEVKYFKDFSDLQQEYKINFDFRNFVTFQDLSGQWANPTKQKALIQALQKTNQ